LPSHFLSLLPLSSFSLSPASSLPFVLSPLLPVSSFLLFLFSSLPSLSQSSSLMLFL
jgi:hypothetical protein